MKLVSGLFLFLAAFSALAAEMRHVVLYEDAKFYSAFPSIVKRPDGELLAAFRRAPERRYIGEPSSSHTDPNSYLVLIRSKDNGKTWSKDPELIYAHPFGGSQDPCMVQLSDNSILCTSYAWARLEPSAIAKLKKPYSKLGQFVFLGGFLVKSTDGARTWQTPITPPSVPSEPKLDIFGKTVPAYNRGALCEGSNGRLHWVVAAGGSNNPAHTSVHLLTSEDKGTTWNYSSVVAEDPKVQFNETSIYETPKGDLVAFARTANMDDQTVIARSSDGGKSFSWKGAGFKGHPHHAVKLPDNRVLLVYGYRHKPFGVRARILNPECKDTETSKELILRDDGGNVDLGYPWATLVSDKEALVVYYFNKANGTRHIAGTFLKWD